MPIKIPDSLPARKHLEQEGVLVMDRTTAIRQDIRPLKILLLNLMPKKQATEIQLARLLGGTPLQVELTLLTTKSYKSTNIAESHLIDFYHHWDDIKHHKYDGMIITGAPVEKMDFADVAYWHELSNILHWSSDNIHELFTICWGAQAAINYFYDIPKYLLDEKQFGIYNHDNLMPSHALMRGVNSKFKVPVSRHTYCKQQDIAALNQLQILASSHDTGACLVRDDKMRRSFMFNHLEYDSTTLKEEYQRDVEQGDNITLPHQYFPNDDVNREPPNQWQSFAHLLFYNWISVIYQSVPYDINDIGNNE